MSELLRRLGGRIALVAAAALVVVALPPTTTAQAAEPVASQLASQVGQPITFAGHGWGHGRGMGQYGALGYAVDYGWGYAAILAHYYGGTTLKGDAGNPTISVELTRLIGTDTIVRGNGLAINGVPVVAGAVRVAHNPQNNF